VKRSLLKRRAAGHQRLFTQGAFFGSPLWRFISVEAPLVAGTSVLPVPKYAFAGPGGVLPLLTSLLAPPGSPLPPLDMPVPPPPAANAKLGTKISATVAKDLSFIEFLRIEHVGCVSRIEVCATNVGPVAMFLGRSRLGAAKSLQREARSRTSLLSRDRGS